MALQDMSLPIHEKSQQIVPSKTSRTREILHVTVIFTFMNLAILWILSTPYFDFPDSLNPFLSNGNPGDTLCPLVPKLDPSEYIYNNETLEKILNDEDFKKSSVRRLANAVRIPTEIYDDTINPNSAKTNKELYELEPLWKQYETFHSYLEETFPLVHKSLKKEAVNKFALLYTWEGKNPDLKPLLLTAHMDVVPVQRETWGQWTHGPFDGVFDGKYIYGRGVSDCKNLLIGLMETIELLLEEGEFKPERTVILGFGYDEESSGTGAFELNKVLLERYGKDSLYAIVDEGNEGFEESEGVKIILPATAEKGHLNSIIELYTPGGHSSVPPDHTLIGILSKLIDRIEEHPFESILTPSSPVLKQLQCVAEHSKSISKTLKSDILKAQFNPISNRAVIDYISKEQTRYLVATSQAVDIVQGGAKSNALPEHVSVLVNHRIALEESVELTANHVLEQIKTVAQKFDLGIIYQGQILVQPNANGYFNYTLNEPLEPAPITPTEGAVWETFTGSLRYLYEDLIFPESSDIYVPSGYVSIGNTDTKNYWDLTKNIYRYLPAISGGSNIHSVDEKLPFEDHLSVIAFYYYYIQVVDKQPDV